MVAIFCKPVHYVTCNLIHTANSIQFETCGDTHHTCLNGRSVRVTECIDGQLSLKACLSQHNALQKNQQRNKSISRFNEPAQNNKFKCIDLTN